MLSSTFWSGWSVGLAFSPSSFVSSTASDISSDVSSHCSVWPSSLAGTALLAWLLVWVVVVLVVLVVVVVVVAGDGRCQWWLRTVDGRWWMVGGACWTTVDGGWCVWE